MRRVKLKHPQAAIWTIISGNLVAGLANLCCILLACMFLAIESKAAQLKIEQPAQAWMQTILNNWETVCRTDLHIPAEPLPWIIFYDLNHAWHLQADKRLLPPYEISPYALRFAGKRYRLLGVAHNESKLWLPDRPPIPVDPAKLQTVTMLYDKERKPFFIIPLPTLFHRLAGADQARNLDEFFIGASAHELTHTRQLVYVIRQIKALRVRYKLPESLDDNLIQQEFQGNAEYKKLYDEERQYLTKAILATDPDECRQAVERALGISKRRKERFLGGNKEGYAQLEDLFLALEGVAMWSQYQTARARAPLEEDWLKTLITLSEKSDAWSQEEGLGLFLLIDRLVPGWQKRFLAADFPSPFTVLQEVIDKRSSVKSTPNRRK